MNRNQVAMKVCCASSMLAVMLVTSGCLFKKPIQVVPQNVDLLIDRDQIIESASVETAPGKWTHVGRVEVKAGDVVIRQPGDLTIPATPPSD